MTAAAPPTAIPQQAAPHILSRAEFLNSMDAEFKKMDANGDGIITLEEMQAYQQRALEAAVMERAKALFEKIDTDHDGTISLAEFLHAQSVPKHVDASPTMMRMDPDHDGKLTLVEFRAFTLANFDRIDADKDGNLSPSEQKNAGLIK